MTLLLYGSRYCVTCQLAEKWLRDRRVDFEARDAKAWGADCLADARLLRADSAYCLGNRGKGLDTTPWAVLPEMGEVCADARDWEAIVKGGE